MSTGGSKYWGSGSVPVVSTDVLRNVILAATDIAIVISHEGQILSVILDSKKAPFGKLDHWEGLNIRDVLTSECIPKLDDRLFELLKGGASMSSVELNHLEKDQEFPIRYSLQELSADDAILMLGRDLSPIAELQQQLVRTQITLEQDYETQREFDTRYRVLMETLEDAVIFVSARNNEIIDLNKAAANLLGVDRDSLSGLSFAHEFTGLDGKAIDDSLKVAAESDTAASIELKSVRTDRHLKLVPTAFRAAGAQMLLCRIRPSDQAQVVSDDLTQHLSSFYTIGVEPMVFTDSNGIITTANEAFLNLVEVANTPKVKGRSLADFMARGLVDLKVMIENASRNGHMRTYSTKLSSEYDNQVSIEVSVTYLNDTQHPAFVFLMRDVSRAEAVRTAPAAAGGGDIAAKSVMELVGSATLKEIVADTTDVVEKMCIETAVELTRNNRVAAAEMLGLSRQSLYVKLRKYGLLAKD
ncbi:transcriptional regulator PpsR [Pseudaestuariivita rosea]|uniref:transcriptional regulator PpsR n=1 Tax=Pseudaestuariivita rosea TaxID=2763263 RepID=UPI001ABAB462|nr:transcriptional regulator PpsR [Pseudaestuariivita rosea]